MAMNRIRFKLTESFQPKPKACRRRKSSARCLWITPDTLFTLCELVLRKLLLPAGVPRRKFWSTIIPLLPNETARMAVWHQVHCPEDFNRVDRNRINYANHWTLLSDQQCRLASASWSWSPDEKKKDNESTPPAVPRQTDPIYNIRIGSAVRNKLTQLLLDLEYYDGQQPQGQLMRSSGTTVAAAGLESFLSNDFVARSTALMMAASTFEAGEDDEDEDEYAKLNPTGMVACYYGKCQHSHQQWPRDNRQRQRFYTSSGVEDYYPESLFQVSAFPRHYSNRSSSSRPTLMVLGERKIILTQPPVQKVRINWGGRRKKTAVPVAGNKHGAGKGAGKRGSKSGASKSGNTNAACQVQINDAVVPPRE
ncbi:uncharacterized protein LOC129744619 isoform X2 [Uranotaenia lowii]|uniref:uncharacterized protein LOC129744619 isoform X2 n=1 Tax=Uranotaenia lowii TaxID=190385 RepID=UPI00247A6F24|nr:uncharacterized protein LOC129744619 isoform X2 [Uranotaenia lowii]